MKLIAISGACKGYVLTHNGSFPPGYLRLVMPIDRRPAKFINDGTSLEPLESVYIEYKLIACDKSKAYYVPKADELVDVIDKLLEPTVIEPDDIVKLVYELREIDPFAPQWFEKTMNKIKEALGKQ